MKRHLLKVLAVAGGLALVLGGCAGNRNSSPATTASQNTETEKQSTTEAKTDAAETSAGGESTKLVIYTNSGGDGRDAWLIEQAKAAGFDINVMNLGGGDLANRAIAEKNNPIADVVFGLNPMEYERMKRENLLMAYEPSWSDQIDKSLGDQEGTYYPIVIQPLLMTYNTDYYNEETIAKHWSDLGLDPEYKGKYTVLGLGGATSKCIIVGILSQYKDSDGEYGISEKGWEVMKQFIQNGHVEQEGEDWFGACQNGERPITELWASGLLQRINEMNLTNMDYMVPEEGTPYIVEECAIFSGSKNPEEAKKFVDWFGSAEVQAAWSAQFGTIPANTDALAQAGQDVKNMMERVHPQDIDWIQASEMVEMWMEKIQLEFVQ